MKAHYNANSPKVVEVKVSCDYCKAEFEAIPKDEYIGDIEQFENIVHRYLECPHCKKHFTIGYIDTYVQQLIDESKKLQNTALTDIKQAKTRKDRNDAASRYERLRPKLEHNREKALQRMQRIKAAFTRVQKAQAASANN